MMRIHILVEGPTEERFVKEILYPCYQKLNIYVDPTCICTKLIKGRKKHRGGHGSKYNHIRRDLIRLLGDRNARVTTMIDLYGLPNDFPGIDHSFSGGCYETARHLEKKFAEDVDNQRFIPNIIVHEFEGLLFSSPQYIQAIMLEEDRLEELNKISRSFPSPEEINDSPDTAPSKRLENLFPSYNKPDHGTRIARRIGLETIRRQCPHFDQWIKKLEKLASD